MVQTEDVAEAVAVLQSGGLVLFPTETFYGAAVDPLQERALSRLDQLKGQRGSEKPYPLILGEEGHLEQVIAERPVGVERWIERFWPGPLTLVLPGRTGLDRRICGTRGGVALRISSHPLARQLALLFGGPLTATSANPSGFPPRCQPAEVAASFSGEAALLLNGGASPGGRASTLVDLTVSPPQILRQGAVPLEELLPFLQGNNKRKER